MPLLPDDLQTPRTAAELRAFVTQVQAAVRSGPAEFRSGMAKRGLYKEFLNEVRPLCEFAEVAYPPDFKVQPMLGNQGYDAVVFDSQGKEFEKVELARPHDGAAAALSAGQVVSRGYSDVQIRDHTDPIGDLIPFIQATAKAKSLKDYSGITLVFTLATAPPLPSLEAAFEKQVADIKNIIAASKFKAKRVLLYASSGRLIRVDA